ncbi:ArsR/SmtB family transcription factor [Halocola ammonii]
MPESAKQNFDPLDVELSKLARSIAHPVRIMILRKLASEKSTMGSEQIKEMPMAPSTVIQHLRDLKKAGLIRGKIFGSNAEFWLVEDQLTKAVSSWVEFSSLLEQKPSSGSKQ